MTAAMFVVAATCAVGALGRSAVLASRRCEVRWRLAPSPAGGSVGAIDAWARGLSERWRARPGPRGRRLVDELPNALDDVARALRAGASVPQALADAALAGGVAASELGDLVARAHRGLSLEENLARWMDERPMVEVRLAATALGLAAAAGGSAAQAVESVAATLRERHAATEEVRVQSVQARLSAVVIALLPLGFTAWCVTTDPRAAAFLLGSAVGWACLTAGLTLLAVGGWWMARIVRSAT